MDTTFGTPTRRAVVTVEPTSHTDFGTPRATKYLETFGEVMARDVDLGEQTRLRTAQDAAARNSQEFPVLARFPISGLAGRSHRGRDTSHLGSKHTGWTPPTGWREEQLDVKRTDGHSTKRLDEGRSMDQQSRVFSRTLGGTSGAIRNDSGLNLQPLKAKQEQDRALQNTMDKALERANQPSTSSCLEFRNLVDARGPPKSREMCGRVLSVTRVGIPIGLLDGGLDGIWVVTTVTYIVASSGALCPSCRVRL